jgi:hypothetical protein
MLCLSLEASIGSYQLKQQDKEIEMIMSQRRCSLFVLVLCWRLSLASAMGPMTLSPAPTPATSTPDHDDEHAAAAAKATSDAANDEYDAATVTTPNATMDDETGDADAASSTVEEPAESDDTNSNATTTNTTTTTSCYSNLTTLLLDVEEKDPFVHETYILCPHTTFAIGTVNADSGWYDDGDWPLLLRRKTTVQCGSDGASHNNCTLRGGSTQVTNLAYYFHNEDPVDIFVRGVTFDGASHACALLVSRGDVTFVDCLFQVRKRILLSIVCMLRVAFLRVYCASGGLCVRNTLKGHVTMCHLLFLFLMIDNYVVCVVFLSQYHQNVGAVTILYAPEERRYRHVLDSAYQDDNVLERLRRQPLSHYEKRREGAFNDLPSYTDEPEPQSGSKQPLRRHMQAAVDGDDTSPTRQLVTFDTCLFHGNAAGPEALVTSYGVIDVETKHNDVVIKGCLFMDNEFDVTDSVVRVCEYVFMLLWLWIIGVNMANMIVYHLHPIAHVGVSLLSLCKRARALPSRSMPAVPWPLPTRASSTTSLSDAPW